MLTVLLEKSSSQHNPDEGFFPADSNDSSDEPNFLFEKDFSPNLRTVEEILQDQRSKIISQQVDDLFTSTQQQPLIQI